MGRHAVKSNMLTQLNHFKLVTYLKDNIEKWHDLRDQDVAKRAQKDLGFNVTDNNVGNIRRNPDYECQWEPMGQSPGRPSTAVSHHDIKIIMAEFYDLCCELGCSDNISSKWLDVYSKYVLPPVED